jgi:2-dehydro-3-deoxyphosphogluconate aldolase/(4S)-4-hydroxy-2-oxoglutarate aldolase
MDLKEFKRLPVMAIVRGAAIADMEPLAEAVICAGLKTIEITMNTPRAADLIRRMKKAAKGKLVVGAGTVLTVKELQEALAAGASFIVTPVLAREVMACCRRRKIPVFPGALTPSEIYAAWQQGAAMVKVFPAKFFGQGYFRELKGPFADIELLACAGVTARNLGDYLSAGASAVSFGVRKDWLVKGKEGVIINSVKPYIEGYNRYFTEGGKGAS